MAYIRYQVIWRDNSIGGTAILAAFLNQVEDTFVAHDTAIALAPVLLIYNPATSSYPARPAGAPAGQVTYKGPVAPSTAIIPDTWEDTTGIWP